MDKLNRQETPAGNSTYKKLLIQLLNEALWFVSNSVVADSFGHRNRLPFLAANCLAFILGDIFDSQQIRELRTNLKRQYEF